MADEVDERLERVVKRIKAVSDIDVELMALSRRLQEAGKIEGAKSRAKAVDNIMAEVDVLLDKRAVARDV